MPYNERQRDDAHRLKSALCRRGYSMAALAQLLNYEQTQLEKDIAALDAYMDYLEQKAE